MSGTDVGRELGRGLAQLRWKGQGLDTAIETLASRADELTPARLARLSRLVADTSGTAGEFGFS